MEATSTSLPPAATDSAGTDVRLPSVSVRELLPHLVLGGLLAVVLGGGDYQPNSDGASYVAIADHYAAGRWGEAINAYWSPLLSWLLAPVRAAGADPLHAFAVLQAVAALGTLALLRSLLRFLGAPPLAMAITSFGIIGLLLDAAALGMGPDLLLCVALLGYVRLAVDPRALNPGWWALATGAVGGLAYLTKAIALPIVAVHLLVWGALRIARAETPPGRHRIAAACLTAVLGLVLVAGPWVAAISARTGAPTISTAATLNLQWTLPGSDGSRLFEPGLIPPPTPNGLSMWEDPAVQAGASDGGGGIETASGTASRPAQIVGGVLDNVADNLVPWSARTRVGALQRLALLGLLVAGVVLAFLRRRSTATLLVLAAAGLHGGALLATYLEPRYALVPVLLLLVVAVPTGVDLMTRIVRSSLLQGVAAVLAAVVLVVPFLPRITALMAAEHDHRELGTAAAPVLAGQDIASDGEGHASMWICVWARCSWHGIPVPADDPEALRRQLVEGGVDYYLSWEGVDATRPAGTPVAGVGGDRFTLYELEP